VLLLGPVAGVALLVVGFVIMSQADNVIRPLLLSGRARMNTLVMILSLLGGVSAFGFIGIVLGPLVAALITALAETYVTTPEAGGANLAKEASLAGTGPRPGSASAAPSGEPGSGAPAGPGPATAPLGAPAATDTIAKAEGSASKPRS
jgi:hypothetical protein